MQTQAKSHYHYKSGKEQAKKYYENKERLKKQKQNKYRGISNEKTI